MPLWRVLPSFMEGLFEYGKNLRQSFNNKDNIFWDANEENVWEPQYDNIKLSTNSFP